MTGQATSWTNADGGTDDPGLVGQIFFPTGGSALDENDRHVLDALVCRYQMLVLGHRIELTCVGHADHRGTSVANRQLGERRSTAVRDFFISHLSQNENFSARRALSRGEELAAQDDATPEMMAEDRRVDVYSNFLPERRVRLPEILIEASPPVQRIVRRRFASTRVEGTPMMGGEAGTSGSDRLNQAVRELVQRHRSPEGAFGSETRGQRRTAEFPMTNRVNRVQITQTEVLSNERSVLVHASDTIVEYTWGQPTDTIQVVQRHRFDDRVARRVRETNTTTTYNREDVAGNTLFFPPDPR